MNQINQQFWLEYFQQCKEIKQKWTLPESFGI